MTRAARIAVVLTGILAVHAAPARAQTAVAASARARSEAEPQGSPPALLTLADALALAAAHNRTAASSRLDVDRAVSQVAEARAHRWPEFDTSVRASMSLRPIDFTVPAGALGVFPSTGRIPAQDATFHTPQQLTGLIYLTVTQPLTQLHKIGLAVREAEAGRSAADAQSRATLASVREAVRSRYYQIASAQAQIADGEAGLRYLTELEALTNRRAAEQTVLRADALAVHAKLAQQEYQVLILTDALTAAREALNELLGRDVAEPFTVEALRPPDELDLDMDAAVREATANRPDLAASRSQEKRASVDVDRARAERLPDVGAQLSYLSFPNVNFIPQNVVSAGVVVGWQPFDWGVRRRHVAEAQVAAEQARLATTDAEQRVALEVRDLFRKVQEGKLLIEAADARRAAEQERLRVMTNRYQEDASLMADLLQQQSAVTQADTEYAQAVASLLTTRASLDRAMGRVR